MKKKIEEAKVVSLKTRAMKRRIRENGDIRSVEDQTVIVGEGINLYRLLSIASMASLQLCGFKTRGGSLFPKIKRGEFDGRLYKGNNVKVLKQFCDFHELDYPLGLRKALRKVYGSF